MASQAGSPHLSPSVRTNSVAWGYWAGMAGGGAQFSPALVLLSHSVLVPNPCLFCLSGFQPFGQWEVKDY